MTGKFFRNPSGRVVGTLCVLLAVISVAVPYALYSDDVSFGGAFTFWTVLTVVVAAVVFAVLSSWRIE